MKRPDMGVGQKHYAAIGRVASKWAAFELRIDSYCWGLAEVEPKLGACMTSQSSGASRKMAALCALAKLRVPKSPSHKLLSKLAGAIADTAERRNRIIHDPWWKPSTREKHPWRWEVSARKTLVNEHKVVSTEKVLELVDEIQDLEANLKKLMSDFGDEMLFQTYAPKPHA